MSISVSWDITIDLLMFHEVQSMTTQFLPRSPLMHFSGIRCCYICYRYSFSWPWLKTFTATLTLRSHASLDPIPPWPSNGLARMSSIVHVSPSLDLGCCPHGEHGSAGLVYLQWNYRIFTDTQKSSGCSFLCVLQQTNVDYMFFASDGFLFLSIVKSVYQQRVLKHEKSTVYIKFHEHAIQSPCIIS